MLKEVKILSLREKKTAKKKQEIVKSAISVIAEKGYHNTTMEDIAANLLMTKGSVYYYFKDKQDLLYQSYKMLLESSIETVTKIRNEDLSIEEKLSRVMIKHIEYLIDERSGFEMGIKPEQFFEGEQLKTILELRSSYSLEFDHLIVDGIESNIFEPVDVKIVRNIMLGAMNWVIQWYSEEGEKSKEEIATSITKYLLRILTKNK
ncbi:TetR/AcrR family transcriptional regulator [Oceanobacillus senegalensis]|uniref:TetR/AcrR family transcriptional regulator n=1 Tax=Oceanobacillus senegalensis TaxID=1936063 RepID=UPI001FE44B25|nr:TetR/AcrR family transcriptional regulator [Oceanobacillus senegalensis]